MIYVMSDIHGNLRRFKSVMKQINLQPEDTLYVLGDVIDRHPYGIKILRQLMKMPNAKMVLGNHEYMMLCAVDEEGTLVRNRIGKHGLMSSLWFNNGGMITLNYLKHLRKDLRREIVAYLKALPLSYDIEVNGTQYKLVHSVPVEWYENSDRYYDNETEFAVWKRYHHSHIHEEPYVRVFGHTPTLYYQSGQDLRIFYDEKQIGIDCGSGFNDYAPGKHDEHGTLACLRLDDMKEFYSEEDYNKIPDRQITKKEKYKKIREESR